MPFFANRSPTYSLRLQLIGFWSEAWSILILGLGYFRDILIHKIEIQLWIVVFFIVILILALRQYKIYTTDQVYKLLIQENQQTFTTNEELVIKILAEADGEYLDKNEMSKILNLQNLYIEQALDGLLAKKFLFDRYDIIARTFRLSDIGRDYAIAKGYVR